MAGLTSVGRPLVVSPAVRDLLFRAKHLFVAAMAAIALQGGVSGGPPVGRAREIRRFIQAASPEIWSETISSREGGRWRESGVACFGLPPWKKIIGGVTVIISSRERPDALFVGSDPLFTSRRVAIGELGVAPCDSHDIDYP